MLYKSTFTFTFTYCHRLLITLSKVVTCEVPGTSLHHSLLLNCTSATTYLYVTRNLSP